MNTIDRTQLLERLNWRYATKQFDPNRKINAQDWATLEDVLQLSPSSAGLQPWKFIVVTDPAKRAALYKEIQEIYVAQAPMIFLLEVPYPIAMLKKVHDFVQIPLGNNVFLNTYLE